MDIIREFPQNTTLSQSEINELKKQIEKLNWNEYIIHDCQKFGIPKILNNIHKENDCNGIISTNRIFCECHKCEGGWGICDNYIKINTKCSKCNYEKYE